MLKMQLKFSPVSPGGVRRNTTGSSIYHLRDVTAFLTRGRRVFFVRDRVFVKFKRVGRPQCTAHAVNRVCPCPNCPPGSPGVASVIPFHYLLLLVDCSTGQCLPSAGEVKSKTKNFDRKPVT